MSKPTTTANKSYKSYAITIRPRNGLHNDLDDAVVKWITKYPFYRYVYEKEGEARHLHAQIWLANPIQIDSVRKAYYRLANEHDPDFSAAAKRVACNGIKIAYNEWLEYLTKENIPIQKLPTNPPPSHESWYPSKEEQEKAQRSVDRNADAYFHRLRELWLEDNPDYETHQFTNVDVATFYYKLMFEDKKIAVVRDPKMRKNNAKALLHYIFPNQFAILEMVLTDKDIEIFNLLKEN